MAPTLVHLEPRCHALRKPKVAHTDKQHENNIWRFLSIVQLRSLLTTSINSQTCKWRYLLVILGPGCWFTLCCSPRHHRAERNHPHYVLYKFLTHWIHGRKISASGAAFPLSAMRGSSCSSVTCKLLNHTHFLSNWGEVSAYGSSEFSLSSGEVRWLKQNLLLFLSYLEYI